jgi:hypothetical protein
MRGHVEDVVSAGDIFSADCTAKAGSLSHQGNSDDRRDQLLCQFDQRVGLGLQRCELAQQNWNQGQ